MAERIKTGIVAFFDILGYKNIIKHNNIYEVAKFISQDFHRIPESVIDEVSGIADVLNIDKEEFRKYIKKQTRPLLISDSILFFCHINSYIDNDTKLGIWWLFLVVCRKLIIKMFKKSLPVRGAIGYGEYFVKRNCFAGSPIIKSYDYANTIDLAGCVLTEEAWTDLKKCIENHRVDLYNKLIGDILFEYSTPFKNGQIKRLMALDCTTPEYSSCDIRQKVFESFQGYNKDVSESKVRKKMENTAAMIKYFVMKRAKKKEN